MNINQGLSTKYLVSAKCYCAARGLKTAVQFSLQLHYSVLVWVALWRLV